jgi:hypothetical protein
MKNLALVTLGMVFAASANAYGNNVIVSNVSGSCGGGQAIVGSQKINFTLPGLTRSLPQNTSESIACTVSASLTLPPGKRLVTGHLYMGAEVTGAVKLSSNYALSNGPSSVNNDFFFNYYAAPTFDYTPWTANPYMPALVSRRTLQKTCEQNLGITFNIQGFIGDNSNNPGSFSAVNQGQGLFVDYSLEDCADTFMDGNWNTMYETDAKEMLPVKLGVFGENPNEQHEGWYSFENGYTGLLDNLGYYFLLNQGSLVVAGQWSFPDKNDSGTVMFEKTSQQTFSAKWNHSPFFSFPNFGGIDNSWTGVRE